MKKKFSLFLAIAVLSAITFPIYGAEQNNQNRENDLERSAKRMASSGFRNYMEWSLGELIPINFNLAEIRLQHKYPVDQLDRLPIFKFFSKKRYHYPPLEPKSFKRSLLDLDKEIKDPKKKFIDQKGLILGSKLAEFLGMPRIEFYVLHERAKIEKSALLEKAEADGKNLDKSLAIEQAKQKQIEAMRLKEKQFLQGIQEIGLSFFVLFIVGMVAFFFAKEFLGPLFHYFAPERKPQTLIKRKTKKEKLYFDEDLDRYLKEIEGEIANWAQGGPKTPSHELLHGPPGSGKTTFATNLSKIEGISFFHSGAAHLSQLKASEGSGATRQEILRLIQEARKEKHAILYVDEIHLLAEADMNVFLEEFRKANAKNVMLIFSTNYPDRLPREFRSRLHATYFPPPSLQVTLDVLMEMMAAKMEEGYFFLGRRSKQELEGHEALNAFAKELNAMVLSPRTIEALVTKACNKTNDMRVSLTHLQDALMSVTGEVKSYAVRQREAEERAKEEAKRKAAAQKLAKEEALRQQEAERIEKAQALRKQVAIERKKEAQAAQAKAEQLKKEAEERRRENWIFYTTLLGLLALLGRFLFPLFKRSQP